MTFSIVARAGDTLGVAVASKFLAVGAAVPAAAAGVGAIATQSYANLAFRPLGLQLLRDGQDAQATLDALIAGDDGRAQRQVGIVDATGGAATYTGDACHAWAGGITGDGVAIQGNILTGGDVVEAMRAAWEASEPTAPLSRRLLAALRAGDDAGGDSRGRQSAALYIVSPDGGYGGGSDQLVDLRVDDHVAPVEELERLLDLHDVFFGHADAASAPALEGQLAAEVRDRLTLAGHAPSGDSTDRIQSALAEWAGKENLEERMIDGRIDPLVLDILRQQTSAASR
jgi:uncharacterized Ntn-hydrolase superfamily protein